MVWGEKKKRVGLAEYKQINEQTNKQTNKTSKWEERERKVEGEKKTEQGWQKTRGE